jgi:hypothetical protein
MPRLGGNRPHLRIAAVFLLLAGCTGNTTHQVCAVVLAVEGSVTADGQRVVAPSGTDRSVPACPGTILRTSADSKAQIACLSNTLVDLSENSTVEIVDLTLRKDGNETEDEMEARSVRCRFVTGTMTIAYKGAEGVSEFIAATPHGTLVAKFSCVVRLAVDNQTTRITCASGMVSFEPSNGRPAIWVEAGFVAESPARGTTIVPAAETAAGQQDVASALEVERQLATLAMARRATLP